MKILCRKRHAKINELAEEFGVSERTIRRDIDVLSINEPIYTKTGRYLGGVHVVDGYYRDKSYFNDLQNAVLTKIIRMAENKEVYIMTEVEIKLIKNILSDYTKPLV